MKYDVARVLDRLGLPFKRHGRNLQVRCISGRHDDQHASLDVRADDSPRHGLFFCRSCDWGGNLVDLVIAARKMGNASDFEVQDAARAWLKEDVAPAPPPRAVTVIASAARGRGFDLPSEVMVEPFEDWPRIFRDYVTARGVTREQVERWGIGYAVDGALAMRVVFVALDESCQPTSYTARTVLDVEPRYKEPSERERADGAAIFGAHLFPGLGYDGRRRGTLFVTEGAFKTLAVERVLTLGRPNVVPDDLPRPFHACALFGSHVQPRHIIQIATFEAVVICSDPGSAGERAGSELVASLKRHVRVERRVLPSTAGDEDGPDLRRWLWRRKRATRS